MVVWVTQAHAGPCAADEVQVTAAELMEVEGVGSQGVATKIQLQLEGLLVCLLLQYN